MMLSKDAIADVVETVRGNDFYRPAHEMIFEAIIDLYGRGEPADLVTVSDELSKRGELQRVGGGAYLADLIDMVPTAANAGFYAEIVVERATLRRLVEAGTRIVQLGYAADGGEVDEVINEAQAQVYAVTERGTSEDFVPLGEVIDETLNTIEATQNRGGQVTGIPTGFAEFDDLTQGLHPGQMVIFAGRPAMGKTTLGMDVLRSASIHNGMASVIFSLEMDKTEITMRLLSAEAQVPMNRMRDGSMDDRDWQAMARAMSRIADAPLFMDDSANMSLMEIRAKCRRLKQKHDLQLVVIDYLQLMSSGKKVESRQQEVSEFSRALKLLAKEIEVPVIAISQLNRGSEQRTDKTPVMSDLRESGSIEQDADLILLIHREYYYAKESARAGEADLSVAKHRHCATKTVTVAFEGHYARVKDMAGVGGFSSRASPRARARRLGRPAAAHSALVLLLPPDQVQHDAAPDEDQPQPRGHGRVDREHVAAVPEEPAAQPRPFPRHAGGHGLADREREVEAQHVAAELERGAVGQAEADLGGEQGEAAGHPGQRGTVGRRQREAAQADTDGVPDVQQRGAVGVADVERAAARDETGEPAAGRGDVADHPLARAVEDVEVIGHGARDLLQHQGVLAEQCGRGSGRGHAASVPGAGAIPWPP